MLLYWVGQIFKQRGIFFVANLPCSRDDFILPGGDILRGLCYFVTPTHMAETMKFIAGLKALGWDL